MAKGASSFKPAAMKQLSKGMSRKIKIKTLPSVRVPTSVGSASLKKTDDLRRDNLRSLARTRMGK